MLPYPLGGNISNAIINVAGQIGALASGVHVIDDGIVHALDLGLFRSVFFSGDLDADFNGDGVVNPIDLGILRSGFFHPPGPSAQADVYAQDL